MCTKQVWFLLRLRILDLCGQGMVSNWELLNLFILRTNWEREIHWLMSNCVWDSIFINNSVVRLEQMFGFLTFKYKRDQDFSGVRLGQIRGFN